MMWKFRHKSSSSEMATNLSHCQFVLAMAIALMVLCTGKQAIAETSPTIAEIRERYQVCRQLRADETGLQKYYGVYTDLEKQDRPVWYRQAPTEGTTLSELQLFSDADDRTGFAELMETTPSGDWSKATEYCFRSDGSLAFVFSVLRTFYGNVRVEYRLYFDKQGKQVREIKRIFDLNSGKRLPDNKSDFAEQETKLFKSARELHDELALSKAEDQDVPSTSPQNNDPQSTPIQASDTEQDEIHQFVGDLVPGIEAVIKPEVVTELSGLRGHAIALEDHVFLANAFYLNNHAELAAWFFAQSVLAGPVSAQALNNLALTLEASYLANPDNRPKNWQSAARILLDNALVLAPRDALIQSNRGWSYFHQWQRDNDPTLLQQAADSLNGAIAIEPGRALLHAHLAEILLAQNRGDLARQSLNRAHELDSAGPAFLAVTGKPGWVNSPEWSISTRKHCDINFKCQQTCPAGIIGRVMVITCEFAQDDARQACGAGKPYPRSYRCEEEIPEYGILIPGLSSGFSIVTPWGRVDMTINGAGKVNYRVKGGPKLPGNLGVELEAKGSYTPGEGIKVQRITPKLSLNIPTGTAAGKQLEQLNMGPATLSVTGENGGTLKVESYD
ncbi:MAG: hypothetical protein V7703_17155, partial [Hyphomicrobiales bacterium]